MNTHVLKRKISINEKGIISLQGDPIPISDELIILDRDRGICNSTAKEIKNNLARSVWKIEAILADDSFMLRQGK